MPSNTDSERTEINHLRTSYQQALELLADLRQSAQALRTDTLCSWEEPQLMNHAHDFERGIMNDARIARQSWRLALERIERLFAEMHIDPEEITEQARVAERKCEAARLRARAAAIEAEEDEA